MAWLIGILIGAICFSVMDKFKIPALLQWIVVFFILLMCL